MTFYNAYDKLATEHQEKFSQQTAEQTEKLDDINNSIVEEIRAEMIAQINRLQVADSAQLTQEQVKDIVTEAMEDVGESLTEAQVQVIVEASVRSSGTN